ncbi:signal peptidase II [Alphaproteobacteria bacterium]|nr:signal peptidase II [Alphaproteobacteria bacterium]
MKKLLKIFETLNKEIVVILITCLSIITDQITKYLAIVYKSSLYPPFEIFSWLNLVYVENRGISFGILSKFNISFYLGLVSFFISFYIIYLLRKSKEIVEKIALSLILAGAIGNGLDRVIREHVVDFIDISFNNFHWPAFNIADSSITLGGIVYFWLIIFKKNH